MNANQQSAIAALDSVRPIAERLDRARDGEDRAADILELWEGTETALRALMGGSSLGGQALIRELRQRELITLGQAYSLLEFLGARDRANRTTYKSTPSDVNAARDGYRQLDAGLRQGSISGIEATPASAPAGTSTTVTQNYAPAAAAAATAAPRNSAAPSPAATTTETTTTTTSRFGALGRGRNRWLIPGIIGALLLIGIAYALLGRSSPDTGMSKAIDDMNGGRREAARTEFAAVARDNPNLAAPHIFLARLSRDEGDLGTARSEADRAVRLEPTNAVALREMGLVLFASREYELARNFFVRSLKANPGDSASSGYLGCALNRLGRTQEGSRFLARAGRGVWSACAEAPTGPPPLTP